MNQKSAYVLIYFLSVAYSHAMEDPVASDLKALEQGKSTSATNRRNAIQTHFRSLLGTSNTELGDDDQLNEQLEELSNEEFECLIAKKNKRNGKGRGWSLFGSGTTTENDKSELIFIMSELNALRLKNEQLSKENERLARENEELMRTKYERCRRISGIVGTLLIGSSVANSWLGSKLVTAFNAANVTVALNSTGS